MNNVFSSYSFEVPSTDPNRGNTKYSYRGPQEFIDKLRAKPVEITHSYTVNGWTVQQFGYSDGTLKSKAEKQDGIETLKIEKITPNRLAKWIKIEIEGDYDPTWPVAGTVSWVEVSDKQNRTNAEFTKIDEQAEEIYQRRFGNSSILSLAEFLYDSRFESMLKGVQ